MKLNEYGNWCDATFSIMDDYEGDAELFDPAALSRDISDLIQRTGAIAHQNLAPREIHILHPQAQALHDAQNGSKHQGTNIPMRTL